MRKVRGQDFRKSLGRMSEQLQVNGLTNVTTTEFKNKLIVRSTRTEGEREGDVRRARGREGEFSA